MLYTLPPIIFVSKYILRYSATSAAPVGDVGVLEALSHTKVLTCGQSRSSSSMSRNSSTISRSRSDGSGSGKVMVVSILVSILTFQRSSRSGMSSRQCSSVGPAAPASKGTTDRKSTTIARGEAFATVADLSSRFSLAIVPETSPPAHPERSSRSCARLRARRRGDERKSYRL